MENSISSTEILTQLGALKKALNEDRKDFLLHEEVTHLVDKLSAYLGEIEESLHDIANKLPAASFQLNDVARATECASDEILILADLILSEYAPTASISNRHPVNKSLQTLEERVADEEGRGAIQVLRQVLSDMDRRLDAQHQQNLITQQRIRKMVLALQFQDITAQQLASVHHTLDAIQGRLVGFLLQMGRKAPKDRSDDSLLESGETFDHQARYETDITRQEEADAIVQRFMDGSASNGEP